MNFTIAIPTYKRDQDLLTCIKSIQHQTTLPSTIIVIDDDQISSETKEEIQKIIPSGVSFLYRKKNHEYERRGLAESRNIAIQESSDSLVMILDDDLILDKDFCKEILVVAEKQDMKKCIGIGGTISNNRKKTTLEKIYNHVFGLTSKLSWDVNEVGYQVWNDYIRKPTKGFYAHGGVFTYNTAVLKGHPFETYAGGRTALEDVELFRRLKKKELFTVITPYATVIHNHSPSGRENSFLSGFKESQNRKHIFHAHSKHTIFTHLWFCWASIGWILRQFLVGKIRKGIGMIYGMLTPRR